MVGRMANDAHRKHSQTISLHADQSLDAGEPTDALMMIVMLMTATTTMYRYTTSRLINIFVGERRMERSNGTPAKCKRLCLWPFWIHGLHSNGYSERKTFAGRISLRDIESRLLRHLNRGKAPDSLPMNMAGRSSRTRCSMYTNNHPPDGQKKSAQ